MTRVLTGKYISKFLIFLIYKCLFDRYVIYKLPHQQSDVKPLGSYIYITSDSLSEGWKLSALSINDSNSIPGLTLQPLYKVIYILV